MRVGRTRTGTGPLLPPRCSLFGNGVLKPDLLRGAGLSAAVVVDDDEQVAAVGPAPARAALRGHVFLSPALQ
jgi:hypothetical protein